MMKFSLIILFYLHILINAEIQYRHPHETNLDNDRLLKQIEQIENIRKSNVDSIPYYQRLVKHLFRKQRFQTDPRSDDYFIANIPLKINKKQYDLLVDTDISGLNINEIDGLVEEVLKQSSNEDWQESATTILYDYYKQEIIDSITTFSSPILWIIVSLITIVIVNRIFHFSRLKFITIIFISLIGICGISYYMTFLDCMHDLEVEQIMALSKDKINSNPCKEYHAESQDYYASFKTWFTGSKKNECKEYMKQTLIPSQKYCNPLEVFFKWLAKLQMSYFGSIFEEFTDFFAKSTSSMDFLSRISSKIIYIAFFGISTIFIIVMFLKYVVQSVPSLISHAASSSNSNNNVQSPSIALLSAKMDEILKENSAIKREISVIRERSEEPQSLPAPQRKKHKLSAIKEAASRKTDESYSDGSS
ncbi:uncharacterized protein [Chironomus tepperi]|uniref:uncharacterized protein n=1 Tax=Chironomus tepperi TaxID=113505 RepID=UPI00391F8761